MDTQTYLTDLISGLAVKRDSIKIDRSVDEMGVLFSVSVPKSEMGKVIGAGGETVKAIRHIMKCVGYVNNQAIHLKVLEPVV